MVRSRAEGEQRGVAGVASQHVLYMAALVLTLGFLAALGWLVVRDAHPAFAAEGTQLDCTKCHNQQLKAHDKLGSGSEACWGCHVSTDQTMQSWHTVSGSSISRTDSSKLCGQCHQERYNAWKEGTHGIAGTVAVITCVSCHDPHQPQVTFENITKPPLKPLETVPQPPEDWVIILSISVGLLFTGAVILGKRKSTS